jgi:hypothetical protein
MPNKHYKYGGSTAARTMNCPAWIELSKKMPKSERGASNDFADRGTLLHNCMEMLIENPDMDFGQLIGIAYKMQIVDQEMVNEAIIPAFEAYTDFADANKFGLELSESEVFIDDEIGGTADIIACNEDTIFIGDFKFGFNLVSPEENAQGLFYAMCGTETEGISHLFDGRSKIVVFIVQPQYGEQGMDIVQAWETTTERLNEFADEYFLAINNQGEDKPIAGDHCKYCPAMVVCPVKTGAARQALMIKPKSEDAAVLAKALGMADEVIEWAKSVQVFAHEQAEQGLRIDGYKLVDKRATRKWSDEAEVLDMVRKAKKVTLDEATDVKLKSAPQLEKLFKNKGLDFKKYDAYISMVSSGTTLVTDTDKRPEAISIKAIAATINSIND